VDEHAAIEAAVRGYLEPYGMASYGAGILGEYARIATGLDADFPGSIEQIQASIGSVTVRSVGDGVAVADVEAVKHSVVIDGAGKRWDDVARYTGPVELVRVEGAWKVANIVRNGANPRDLMWHPEIADHFGDIGARGLVARVEGSLIHLYCAFDNQTEGSVVIAGVSMARRKWWGRWQWARRVVSALAEAPSGTTTFAVDGEFDGFAFLRPRRSKVRLIMRTDVGVLDVRPAGVRARRRRMRPLRIDPILSGTAATVLFLVLVHAPLWLYAALVVWTAVMYQRYWRRRYRRES
jgi:hypothetical protein